MTTTARGARTADDAIDDEDPTAARIPFYPNSTGYSTVDTLEATHSVLRTGEWHYISMVGDPKQVAATSDRRPSARWGESTGQEGLSTRRQS